MRGKEVLFDIDMDDQDEDKNEQNLGNIQKGSKIQGRIKGTANFQSNFMMKNLLHQDQQEDYHNAVVIPCQSAINRKSPDKKPKIEKKTQQPQKDIQPQLHQKQQMRPIHRSIHLLGEIDYESSDCEDTQQEENKAPIVNSNQSQSKQKPQKEGKNNPSRSSIANIDFEDSDQDEENSSEGSQNSHYNQLRKILAMKHYQLEPISIKDIATTHDPYENMKIFSQKEVDMKKILSLKMVRNQSGLNTFWPQFRIYLGQNAAKVLVAKKMMGSTSSNYYITLEGGIDDVNHDFFIAKMRSNFSNNIYTVYSKGVNPKNAESGQKIRSVEATIVFHPLEEVKRPRSFDVFVLATKANYSDLMGFKKDEQIGLDQLYVFQENKGKIFKFTNRKPVYSAAIQGYILNFGARLQVASIKNFILEDVIAHREALMLGKIQNDIFRIDVSWPLKPYIGLCVCIANMDSNFTKH